MITFCFRLYFVNRSTKLHEILVNDTSISSKCRTKNSERLVFLDFLTNCLRGKREFPVFHEGVPEKWMIPKLDNRGIVDKTADCNTLTDVFS
jgi:hypothetical protein